jgi:hypothetical protein
MAASGFTPISLYYSTTAAAAPTAGNLVDGELAINITDGKLYYKDNAGAIQLLASRTALTSVDSISFGSTGLTPSTATTGAVTVAGTLAIANGGTGATTNTAARTNLGASTLGANVFTITNPSAITFPRFNADNTVSALNAADFRTAIGAGTGGGSVTSVSGTGTVNGITLTGTVTSSGSLTLGGTLSGVSLTTQVSGTLPVANGGTGITSLGAGVATFLGTPSSANLAAAVTDETGTGALVFGTSPTFSGNVIFSSTGAITAPVGTTAERPTAATGMLRFNSDTPGFEGYNGTAWSAVGGGNSTATGLWENASTISSNYTVTVGNNAMSAGPITVSSGVTVTVPSGSTWTIV